MKKRLSALICAVCMITAVAAYGFAEEEGYTVAEKSVTMYLGSAEKKQDYIKERDRQNSMQEEKTK